MYEHGVYITDRTEQLLLFSAKGPWNDETMFRGVKELSQHISLLDQTIPWGQISCLYGESLMPPSTNEVFKKQTLIRKKLGLSAIAVIIKDSDISLTIQNQLSKTYIDAGIEHRFMQSPEQGIDWVQSMNIDFDPDYARRFFLANAL